MCSRGWWKSGSTSDCTGTIVEEEANLPTVRGRILVAADLHWNAVLRHRTYCRFTTYSWDLRENQIVRHVVHLLSG